MKYGIQGAWKKWNTEYGCLKKVEYGIRTAWNTEGGYHSKLLHVHAHAAGRGRLLDKRSVLRGRGGRVAHDAAVCASAVSLSSLSPSLCGKLRPSVLSVRTLRVMAAASGQLVVAV